MIERNRAGFSVATALTASLLLGCKNPTEITLDVRTDVACTGGAPWKGVAIYVGHPGDDVETKQPTLVTTTCDASGEIGTLVIKPSGADDEDVGIRVVGGIARAPEECAAANYAGCIVERRTLRFLPSTPVNLVIDLPRDCTGVGCAVGQTCSVGACVDDLSASAGGAGSLVDGGVPGPQVRCGDNGVRCGTTGLLCCLSIDTDAGTTTGDCRLPHDCPPTSAVLACDDATDCAGQLDDAGEPFVCCAQNQHCDLSGKPAISACVPASACMGNGTELLCQNRTSCPAAGNLCAPASFPGYFSCRPQHC